MMVCCLIGIVDQGSSKSWGKLLEQDSTKQGRIRQAPTKSTIS